MIQSIEDAIAHEALYKPSDPKTLQALATVTLATFVGPTAVGKNFNMEMTGLPQAGTITTRDPREGDVNYRYFDDEAFFQKINRGEFAQYGVYGPEGPMYATDVKDYTPNAKNVMDTTYGGVETLIDRGVFKAVRPIGVLAPVDLWESRLEKRFAGQPANKIASRLTQASETLAAIQESYVKPCDRLVIVSTEQNTQSNLEAINTFIETGYTVKKETDSITEIVEDMIELLTKLKRKHT